ncbi:hypothetical protein HBH53_142380 [Parastagonospora nodorum]|nr:hypothetical protein HBH53_142380 [Parastagonospora nodorum]KAH4034334.1 hypothetical protein HBI09_109210 [Parastagonospora nodorum]KAH4162323.1 hypothetical protein HBH44_088140 [Parastagonospora nodorum]KAH4248609.1 hypothetical protein HBI05_021750 [Parastagonospora nodorum]KAH4852563.1 hypothetical protein HBH75_112240 [Parastagonospora nodorum]
MKSNSYGIPHVDTSSPPFTRTSKLDFVLFGVAAVSSTAKQLTAHEKSRVPPEAHT